jgi:hypothetical protein
VRRRHDRGAGLVPQPGKLAVDGFTAREIKEPGRFIEKHESGSTDKSARQDQAHPHSGRVRPDRLVDDARLEARARTRGADQLRVVAGKAREEAKILEAGKTFLELPLSPGNVDDTRRRDSQPSGARKENSRKKPQERGLAAPVRAGDRENLAGLEIKRDAFKRGDVGAARKEMPATEAAAKDLADAFKRSDRDQFSPRRFSSAAIISCSFLKKVFQFFAF